MAVKRVEVAIGSAVAIFKGHLLEKKIKLSTLLIVLVALTDKFNALFHHGKFPVG